MDAVIPAAGRGSRMGALTENQPKALVLVGDRPLIEHALEAALTFDVTSLVIVVGYQAEAIMRHLGDHHEGRPITYVHQRQRRGLADALLCAHPHVSDRFLVLNGDNVFDGDLAAVQEPIDDGADAAVLVDQVPPADATETGVVDIESGRIVGVIEKPDRPPSTWVTTGCYLLSEDVFHACRLVQPSDTGEYELTAAIDLLCRAGHSIAPVELQGSRWNVNAPDDIAEVEERLSNGS